MQISVQRLQAKFNTKNKALFIPCSLLSVKVDKLRS